MNVISKPRRRQTFVAHGRRQPPHARGARSLVFVDLWPNRPNSTPRLLTVSLNWSDSGPFPRFRCAKLIYTSGILLAPGTRVGAYDILSALGAGGMGEVYRARDTKLNRGVAIKVLLPAVANDPDRLARFSREAQVLASLNHPNIAHIHGLEESGGVTALVMELVEGEDLSQRIARGPIPLDEALPIARQIAEALEAAHDHGIIHRDLKPANIKVRPDSTVKVLDFGLAKAIDPAPGSSMTAANSPTLSIHATQAGIILGTAAYMSPEQARGKAVDKRTDIWALGCVLFEMLTGTRAFPGDDATDTIVAVVTKEPDWAALPPPVPLIIRKLLRRSLEKDPKKRLDSAAGVRLEIDEALQSPTGTEQDGQFHRAAAPARRRERVAWAAAAVLAVTLLAGSVVAVMRLTEPAAPATPVGFTVDAPLGTTFITPQSTGQPWLAVSPDGRTLAFVALAPDGRQQLWLRSLASASASLLRGTDDARAPFWSPDSRFVAFFAQGKLKYVDARGGAAQVIADAPRGAGGSWGRDNVVVFNRYAPGAALDKVSVGGNGDTAAVTTIDPSKGQFSHAWPDFLPDGRHFLFAVTRAAETETWIGSVDGAAPQFLFKSEAGARYAAPGYLVFVAQGLLMARPFDADAKRFTGEPFKVDDAPGGSNSATSYAAVAPSAAGVLAYGTSPVADQQLVWRDRDGRKVGELKLPFDARSPSLSPDGSTVAFNRRLPQAGVAVWLFDLNRGLPIRLTLESSASHGVWSPDGKFVAFSSFTSERRDVIHRKLANGSGAEEIVLDRERSLPTDWSRDGKFILFHATHDDPAGGMNLWMVPLGGGKPVALLNTPFTEVQGVLSPDMKWLAYAADESGVMEVYVQPFPPTGVKRLVSRGGGAEPRWRADGRELFYASADRRLMAVPVSPSPAFEAGLPNALFVMDTRDLTAPFAQRRYAPTPDGRRFLIAEPVTAGASSPITVLVNWAAMVRQ
jgi:eukaryotic-like serine/threonine-protein kinase